MAQNFKLQLFADSSLQGRTGQIVTWGALGLTIFTCLTLHFHDYLPRANVTTIASLLPDSVIYSDVTVHSLRLICIVSSVFWIFNVLLLVSPGISAASFFLLLSVYMERVPYAHHQWRFLAILLILLATWYTSSAREIGESRRVLGFGRITSSPAWMMQTMLVYASLGYTYSGITKLAHGGVLWGDGLSLQIWTFLFSLQDTFLRDLILSSRSFAGIAQSFVVLVETLAVVSLFSRQARILLGISLLGFQLANELLFGFGFYANMVCLGFAFLCNPAGPVLSLRRGRALLVP